MRRALTLAQWGQGRVEPNPMVGAVLARDGEMVAEGYHPRFGGDHAEVEALNQAERIGIDAAGCHLFVSLEPCCHHGKTPPCTDAIIDAGISHVWVAMEDPSAPVAGRGIANLKAAGIPVDVGRLAREAKQLNAPFIKRATTDLPWVIVKWAQTLDGKIATASGDSKWISNATSRKRVHELRARVDAIMVGVGTVLADDPLLTARDVLIRRRARRVVVDPRLRLPLDSALVRSLGNDGPPLTIAIGQDTLQSKPKRLVQLQGKGVEVIALPSHGSGYLSLRPLLQQLSHNHLVTNVLVEGGATLIGRLLAEKLADQILAFTAPRVLGDANATSAISGLSRAKIAEADTLILRNMEQLGDDVLLDYWFTKTADCPRE